MKTEVSKEEHDGQPGPSLRFCPEVFALFSPAFGFNDSNDPNPQTNGLNDPNPKNNDSSVSYPKTIDLQDSPVKSDESFMPDVSGVFWSDKISEDLSHTESSPRAMSNMKPEEQLDKIALETPVRKLNTSTTSNSTSSGWSPEYESGLSCTDDIEVVVIDLNDTPDFEKDATSTSDTDKETRTLLAGDTELVASCQVDADAENGDGRKPGEVCVKPESVDNVQKLSKCSDTRSKKDVSEASSKTALELSGCSQPRSEKVETKSTCEEVRRHNECSELFGNFDSTVVWKNSSAIILDKIRVPEAPKKEDPQGINKYRKLQILSDTRNRLAKEAWVGPVTLDFKKDATSRSDTNKETRGNLLAGDREFVPNGPPDADAGNSDGRKPVEVCVKSESVDNVEKLSKCSDTRSKKVVSKPSSKTALELTGCSQPESEKVETKSTCEEVRRHNERSELFGNFDSTVVRKYSSAIILDKMRVPEAPKKEDPQDINEYLRLQILSDTKTRLAKEALVGHDVKTFHLESENTLQEPFSSRSHSKSDRKDIDKSSDKRSNNFKVPSMQDILPELEKLKVTVTSEKFSASNVLISKCNQGCVKPKLTCRKE